MPKGDRQKAPVKAGKEQEVQVLHMVKGSDQPWRQPDHRIQRALDSSRERLLHLLGRPAGKGMLGFVIRAGKGGRSRLNQRLFTLGKKIAHITFIDYVRRNEIRGQ
jgi:hypothetical protein